MVLWLNFWYAYVHYDWLKTVLIYPGNFSSGDRSTEEIKVILIDCYHHSHLFPLEFPLFPACVRARARLLCLSHYLCFCTCAWVCICYQAAADLNANVCAYACVCVVCFNMSATCGNLIIWKWNMCSCLCLSNPAPPRSFSSFLCPSFFDSSNKFGRSGYTRWYMPTSPCISFFSKSPSSFFCPKILCCTSRQFLRNMRTDTHTHAAVEHNPCTHCLCRPLRLLTFSSFAHIK